MSEKTDWVVGTELEQNKDIVHTLGKEMLNYYCTFYKYCKFVYLKISYYI